MDVCYLFLASVKTLSNYIPVCFSTPVIEANSMDRAKKVAKTMSTNILTCNSNIEDPQNVLLP